MKLTWDNVGERYYETGVSKGALFVQDKTTGKYKSGVAWSGLTKVSESPEGAEPTDLYADNTKYATLVSREDFKFTIEAYQSPEEFDECDGSASPKPGVYIGQQSRVAFGLTYRTEIGNDVTDDAGYKLHFVYGCKAKPSSKDRQTINDSPEASTLSWECTSTPVEIPNMKPSAHIYIDSRYADPTKLKELETMIYGSDAAEGSEGTESKLPMPSEIIAMFPDVISQSPEQEEPA